MINFVMVTAMLSLTYLLLLCFPIPCVSQCFLFVYLCGCGRLLSPGFQHYSFCTAALPQPPQPYPVPSVCPAHRCFNAQAYPGPKDMEGPMIKVTGRKKIMLHFCGVLSCRGGAGVNILKNHCDWEMHDVPVFIVQLSSE